MLSKARQKAADAKSNVDFAASQAEATAEAAAEPIRDRIDQNIDNEFVARQAQDTVNALVVVGATLLIGIIVYSKIQTSTPDPANSDLNNSSQSVTDNVASSFDLGSILPIVIVAGAILFYLRGFGGGGQRR